MIEFDRVTVTYAGATEPAIRDVSFTIPEGELALVIGRTGSGPSTDSFRISPAAPWPAGYW